MSAYIDKAVIEDIPALVCLLNKAYRGPESQKGWTSEAHLIDGETRTDEQELLELISNPASVFLKFTSASGQLQGCVNLRNEGTDLYLGMLGVDPSAQGSGIGKQLLVAAETHARQIGCSRIHITVISMRQELADWYMRHGYSDTGERIPFIESMERSGAHLQPLEFMVMEKII